MKRAIAFLLAAGLLLCLCACSGAQSGGEVKAIQDKGTLVVGITDYEPMDYRDADGNWTGFDAEMAEGFAEYLGVKVEFVEIDWDNKILELDGKTVDCIWNGMTLTDEVKEGMDCTDPYLNNAQAVIIKADAASQYASVEDMSGLTFAVEAGSAGEKEIVNLGYATTPVKAQSDALLEASAGTSDAAVVDLLMALCMVGDGTDYSDLTHTFLLNSESFGVGFRKGSDLTAKANEYFAKCYEDGTIQALAEKYNLTEMLVEK